MARMKDQLHGTLDALILTDTGELPPTVSASELGDS